MRSAMLLLSFLAILSCFFIEGQAQESSRSKQEFRVIGYLPDYRFDQFESGMAKYLTDMIIFSAEPDRAGGLDVKRIARAPWSELRKAKEESGVKLMVAVGGWNRSEHFAFIAASEELRSKFAQSLVDYCLREKLDGADLDWEHPSNATEEAGYGLLIEEIKKEFDRHNLELSVTVAAWQNLPAKAVANVDRVQVMAYDHEGDHSSYEGMVEDIEKVLLQKVPCEKLVLGLPFYGRDVNSREAMTYREILQKHNPPDVVDQVGNMAYNGPKTIQKKTEFALGQNDAEQKFAGVMVWEIGQDAPGDASLLRVIHSTIKNSLGDSR